MQAYTVDQIANQLQVKLATVRKWLRQGLLTGLRTPAGWQIPQADLDKFIDSQQPAKKAETAS